MVRARVAAPRFIEHLRAQIRDFPPEFLLFLKAAVAAKGDLVSWNGRQAGVKADDGAGWNQRLAQSEPPDFIPAFG